MGGVVGLALIGALLWFLCVRRKRKEPQPLQCVFLSAPMRIASNTVGWHCLKVRTSHYLGGIVSFWY